MLNLTKFSFDIVAILSLSLFMQTCKTVVATENSIAFKTIHLFSSKSQKKNYWLQPTLFQTLAKESIFQFNISVKIVK